MSAESGQDSRRFAIEGKGVQRTRSIKSEGITSRENDYDKTSVDDGR